jgi:hypothetical protein
METPVDDNETNSFLTPGRVRALIALILVVVIAGAGWWFGRSGPTAEVAQLNQELEQARAQLEASERLRDETIAAAELRKAHIELLEGLNELDRRNFGMVDGHLDRARSHLAKVDAEALGIDAAALASLRQELEGVTLSVSADLNEQRQKLLGFDAQVRALTRN